MEVVVEFNESIRPIPTGVVQGQGAVQ